MVINRKIISIITGMTLLTGSMQFSVAADVSSPVTEENSEQSRIVTEYYTQNILENYETGEIQTAAKISDHIDIEAKSAILIEQTTGEVLYEDNADEPMSPASITKIMSLLLIVENIEAGNMRLDTEVTCSEHAASMGGSQIWLEPNEKMTVHDLLKAVAVGSANDATCALAEAVAGSEEAFVARMNERAAELNMNNTVFKNCSGLDADGHLSTARDIAIMSKELLKHDMIYDYTTIWMDTLRNGANQLVNTNKLVRFYEGATGLKTGTTAKAGCCLSASAKRNGLSLIAVVMGSENSDKRFRSARKLLDMGFANYEFADVKLSLKKDDIPVEGGTEKIAKLVTEKSMSFLVPKGQTSKISLEYELPEKITAPVNKGAVVGRISVKLGENELGTAEIKSACEVKKMNFGRAFIRMMEHTFMM